MDNGSLVNDSLMMHYITTNNIKAIKSTIGICYNVNNVIPDGDKPDSFLVNNRIVVGTFRDFTLLHYACGTTIRIETANSFNRVYPIEIIKYLVENNADVNKKDGQGRAPLHYACSIYFNSRKEGKNVSDISVIEYLLENGADINIQDNYGTNPLIYIIDFCTRKTIYQADYLIRYLIRNGCKMGFISEVTNQYMDYDILLRLYPGLMNGHLAYINKYRKDLDIKENYFELLEIFNINSDDLSNRLDKIIELIEYLIDNGANVNAADFCKETLLYNALKYGTIDHCKRLIEKGASMHKINAGNLTALETLIDIGYTFGFRFHLIKYFTELTIKITNLKRSEFKNLKDIVFLVNYSLDNENNIKIRHEIADILVRKGFYAKNYSINSKMGNAYQLYMAEKENVKKICQKKNIFIEIEKHILSYLGEDTIFNVKFLFPLYESSDSDSDNNPELYRDFDVNELYNPKNSINLNYYLLNLHHYNR